MESKTAMLSKVSEMASSVEVVHGSGRNEPETNQLRYQEVLFIYHIF